MGKSPSDHPCNSCVQGSRGIPPCGLAGFGIYSDRRTRSSFAFGDPSAGNLVDWLRMERPVKLEPLDGWRNSLKKCNVSRGEAREALRSVNRPELHLAPIDLTHHSSTLPAARLVGLPSLVYDWKSSSFEMVMASASSNIAPGAVTRMAIVSLFVRHLPRITDSFRGSDALRHAVSWT